MHEHLQIKKPSLLPSANFLVCTSVLIHFIEPIENLFKSIQGKLIIAQEQEEKIKACHKELICY